MFRKSIAFTVCSSIAMTSDAARGQPTIAPAAAAQVTRSTPHSTQHTGSARDTVQDAKSVITVTPVPSNRFMFVNALIEALRLISLRTIRPGCSLPARIMSSIGP